MEGFPFRLSLSLILAAVVVTVVFSQLLVFNDSMIRKKFADDINTLRQAFDTLASTGDYGSFSRVHFKVPQGCYVRFVTGDKNFTVNFFGSFTPFNISGTLKWDTTLISGTDAYIVLVRTKNATYREDVLHRVDNLTIGFQ